MRQKNLIVRSRRWPSVIFLLLFLTTAVVAQAQQEITVVGIVTEAGTQMPLPGVTIMEQGTNNGTATDFDGNYTLTVPSDAILVASFVGYASQEIPVDGSETINITMSEDAQSLNEVVVVGYGTQKKSDLTGAITSVGSEALTERNTTSALEAVQGNVAGVQISSSTGRTGDGFNVVIRGQNSTSANSNPLFVVDGVPTDNIDFLNP